MTNPVIRALLFERLGYERRGLFDRVAMVDEQLRALGYEFTEQATAPAAPEKASKPKSRKRKG